MKPTLSNTVHQTIKEWWNNQPTTLKKEATRKGFGNGALQSVKKNKNLFVITADLAGSTSVQNIKEQRPKQFLDVGVAEQTLAGVAAGIASEQQQVIITSFATFNPGRNWDFIRTQIAYNKLPVMIVGSHAGLATGPDGATHQALEDVALMRSLPDMIIASPADAKEAEHLIPWLLAKKQPTYIRLAREKTPVITTTFTSKPQWLCKGKDVTIISTGITAFNSLAAAKQLWDEHRVSASVVHVPIIKPLDVTVMKKILQAKLVATIEDHNIIGGLGSAVAEYLAENGGTRMIRLGVQDKFGCSGTADELYKKYGLDPQSIMKKILKEL